MTFVSPADQSPQKTLLYVPSGDDPVPLLVAFHTWSGDYRQDQSPYADWCIAHGWAMVHPDLRGPSIRPEAAGSDLTFADLRAVLDLVRQRRQIDAGRIYAVGASGGGMMTLLAAARMPEVWAAASAWVPVTDLVDWHADSRLRRSKYVGDIEGVCGGPPGFSPEVDAAYASRSAVARLGAAFAGGRLPFALDIHTGIDDGHTGSVPVSHAIRAFNAVAAKGDSVSPSAIDALVRRSVPSDLLFDGIDPLYASHPVRFRRTSDRVRLTVFAGGHEILYAPALTWLGAQRRGQAPDWHVKPEMPSTSTGTRARDTR